MFNRVGIIALRILWQFRRDRRSLALVFVVPVVIMGLMTALIRSGSQSLEMAITGPGRHRGSHSPCRRAGRN